MMKKALLHADFEHLVYLIRNHVKLNQEERELWERSLKKIEDELDNPLDTEVIVKYKPNVKEDTFKESLWRRFKNWLILKLK
jgi:hypothetical protein